MPQNILDDMDFKEPLPSKCSKIISFLLALGCIVTWLLLFQAGDLPYDENFANLLMAFLLSVVLLGAVGILFFWKRPLWEQNMIAILIYFLSSSPPVVAVLCMNYTFVFGKVLAV